MARYQPYNLDQGKLIPVSFRDQILPDSFEHALNDIVEKHIDLTPFEERYANDDTGRLAYDPAVLLKIVLYGYYRGIVSSRRLAEACERNVQFMALSADTRPHFTTIAGFISQMHREVASVFTDVLLYASELNLIGRDTFAIDGCKLPSNASKQWSGTLKELRHKQKKLKAAAQKIVARHQTQDAQEKLSPVVAQEEKKRATYARKIDRIKRFLKTAQPNLGPSGKERKRNITDPDSAKMSTNHGVIQGYNGIAVVDAQHQIVVTAEAHGEGQEAHLLAPMIESTRHQCQAAGIAEDIFDKTKLTADAGYSSQNSVQYTQDHQIDAYIADRDHRHRDPVFAGADRYKERSRQDKRRRAGSNPHRFTAKDFDYDAVHRTCRCPAGNNLYRNGNNIDVHGYLGVKFRGAKSVCGPCTLRHRCLTTPQTTETKQVTLFIGKTETRKESPIEKMKRKFDTVQGRFTYNQRIAIVEPVFANLQNKGLRRFTLRGKDKVDAQWKLFTLVHNIEKIAHCGAS
ncbi:MAG TPA: IS1182 family transposase [Acidiferrobacterales bacterium]|jgi:transposase